MQKIFFSDLDGTMLDYETYSSRDIKGTLALLNERNMPLVFCSSKTAKEIDLYKKKLKNIHPFISENGGAIFIPMGYFGPEIRHDHEDGKYQVIRFGESYGKLVSLLKEIKKKYDVKGFFEMSATELAKDSGLPEKEAALAKERSFSEPFRITDSGHEKDVLREITEKGFEFTRGGRYYHLMKGNDKGRAVRVLSELFRKKYGKIMTIAVGDSDNDLPMLKNADRGYLVMRNDGSYASKDFLHSGEAGPKGWVKVIGKEIPGEPPRGG